MEIDVFDLVKQNQFEKQFFELNKDKQLVNLKHPKGYGLLHVVSEFGPPNLVQFLIDEGLETNDRDASGETPLFWAVAEPNPQAADVLLANGADPEIFNDEGFAPIHTALYEGGIKTINYFLSRGLSIHSTTIHDATLLHLAAGALDESLISFLIEKGLDINSRDNNGWTPLMYSMLTNSVHWDRKVEISGYLLKLGADPHLRSKVGENAWDLAKQFTKDDFLDLLRRYYPGT